MERDSFFYIARRKMQVMAHKIFPDKIMSKFYFNIILKEKLDLENPKSFNEKLQWLKLFYYPNNPLVVQCTDKFAVREYIAEKGYADKLVPLAGVWDDVKAINWDVLPDSFVMKCNHGCAYNLVCHDKNSYDKEKAIRKLNKWLKEDFGAYNIEIHYSMIKQHKILCEEFLGDKITDYKFFCFNGELKYMYVSNDLINDRQAQIGFFYLDGSKMPLAREEYEDLTSIVLPEFYDEMLTMSKELCKDFPFVRVDFFIANNTFYFAELTFTPGACMIPFDPKRFDLEWGEELDISESIKKIS